MSSIGPRNWYEVLGVAQDATRNEIKKAYIKISQDTHPDTHPGDTAANERFKEAAEAWGILGNEKKRKEFDDQRGGRRRAEAPRASDIARWTPETSDTTARRIVEGRRCGEETTVLGDTYVVELVTFGSGDDAEEHAALTCNGEVLETGPQPPTSHRAASAATHKRFAAAHSDVAYEMAAAAGKRQDWARVVTELRTRLCEGDASLGEGNVVRVNGNEYSVAVIIYGEPGNWKGQRVLMRNGASLENLPVNSRPTRFASATDFDVFFSEQDMLGTAIDDFLATRAQAWAEAPKLRRDLDPGDSVTVKDVTYGFDWVSWKGADGKETKGMVLCADGVPLEKLPGRASKKEHRGVDIETLYRFLDNAKEISKGFEQLRDGRSMLRTAASPLMQDLVAGDSVPWGNSALHVEMLDWATQYSTGKDPVLCFGQIALNPHWGTITTPGYRRASLAEAKNIAQSGGLGAALSSIIAPRRVARERTQWEWNERMRQEERAKAQMRWEADKADKEVRRENRKGILGGLGRLISGGNTTTDPSAEPPPPGGPPGPPGSGKPENSWRPAERPVSQAESSWLDRRRHGDDNRGETRSFGVPEGYAGRDVEADPAVEAPEAPAAPTRPAKPGTSLNE